MADDVPISRRNLRPVAITSHGECTVLAIGTMEIWDGAELALLRETMRRLIEEDGCRTLGVDMNYVMYIPSGFFGSLCDWHDNGITIRLWGPLPHVRQMLWFTRFFHSIGDDFYELRPFFESDFVEPASECARAGESIGPEESPLISIDDRNSNLPGQANDNAPLSAGAPVLSQ